MFDRKYFSIVSIIVGLTVILTVMMSGVAGATGGLPLDGAAAQVNARLQAFKSAMAQADSIAKKQEVLRSLADIRHERALKFAAAWLEDEALGAEAARTIIELACPSRSNQTGVEGTDVRDILQKAIQFCKVADLRQRATACFNSMSTPMLNRPPKGFVALFNGEDRRGWKGLLDPPYDNPIKRAALAPDERARRQKSANEKMRQHWSVQKGVIEFDGKGFSLATGRDYRNFELWVDWKVVHPRGDSGIYLRGAPQVQIWDPDQHKIGSGGLYNNKKNISKPLVTADNPIGQWNTFRIRMVDERVTVYLNGVLVVDHTVMENYWDRSRPIFPTEQIELQCHGNPIHFRNIYLREITTSETKQPLFNGKDLTGWKGDTKGYIVEDGSIVCKPGGNLYTVDEFDNFILEFEFKLAAGANNGLGIRTPFPSHAAYDAMELQILDNTADQYKTLKPYQYHGSVYGVVPAKRGCLKPVGEWNREVVIAQGSQIVVILNDQTIVDADVIQASTPRTMDGRDHPGLQRRRGHIAFLGHGSRVAFRNLFIQAIQSE